MIGFDQLDWIWLVRDFYAGAGTRSGTSPSSAKPSSRGVAKKKNNTKVVQNQMKHFKSLTPEAIQHYIKRQPNFVSKFGHDLDFTTFFELKLFSINL